MKENLADMDSGQMKYAGWIIWCKAFSYWLMMVSKRSVPLHIMLITSLSPWRPRFNHRSVCMEFLVDRVAMQRIFLPVLRLLPVAIISPVLHSHVFITDAIYT